MKVRQWVLWAAVGVAAVAWLAYRVRQAPEWTAWTGTVAERQTVCRSLYRKPAWRAAWSLRRLLVDPAPAVRMTALAGLAERADLRERLRSRVEGLARGDADGDVRARALVALLQHDGRPTPEWLDRAFAELQDAGRRDRHPDLLALVLAGDLGRASSRPAEWLLSLLEAGALEDARPFEPVLRFPDRLRPCRVRLIDALARSPNPVKPFVLAALAAVDGAMRGTEPEDWRAAGEVPLSGGPAAGRGLERFTVEAEWAHRVYPNFQVDVEQDELGLVLGEGAGGDHFWRQHAYSTVDIGKAQFDFTLSREGRYQIWCRCWFCDKCGNHSLLHIDDRWLQWRDAGADDHYDALRKWHWKRLETAVRLTAGKHTLAFTAGDDGLLYDKLAILPAEEAFDPDRPPPLNPLWTPEAPTTVSLTAEFQAQPRGRTRTVTAWVRRNSGRVVRGEVTLAVPAPFEVVGPATVGLEFASGVPVAPAAFRVLVPEGSVGGEVEAKATFRVDGQEVAAGTAVLGVVPDWFCTGPLAPTDPRCVALLKRTSLTAADLASGWARFPEAGLDRYRRLDVEAAYGETTDAYVFLYTEIEVGRTGDYVSLLTLDDNGFVYIGGQRVAGRSEPGVGEGWLLMDPVHLEAGRHPVFAWVYQADFPEPTGDDAGRHTPNHWNFKWLLRESRHRPAADIRGLPVARP